MERIKAIVWELLLIEHSVEFFFFFSFSDSDIWQCLVLRGNFLHQVPPETDPDHTAIWYSGFSSGKWRLGTERLEETRTSEARD